MTIKFVIQMYIWRRMVEYKFCCFCVWGFLTAQYNVYPWVNYEVDKRHWTAGPISFLSGEVSAISGKPSASFIYTCRWPVVTKTAPPSVVWDVFGTNDRGKELKEAPFKTGCGNYRFAAPSQYKNYVQWQIAGLIRLSTSTELDAPWAPTPCKLTFVGHVGCFVS